jgi:hypothetical protein
MIFACETVRQHDASGETEAVGVRWTEVREYAENALDFCAIVAFIAAVACLSGLFYPATRIAAVIASPILAVIGLRILKASVLCPGKRRELMFMPDGLGLMRFGCSLWPSDFDRLALPHFEIKSIEAWRVPRASGKFVHGVKIYYRGGEVAEVASRLSPDQAHMVAVKLTQALAELRPEMASTLSGHVSGKKRTVEVVID